MELFETSVMHILNIEVSTTLPCRVYSVVVFKQRIVAACLFAHKLGSWCETAPDRSNVSLALLGHLQANLVEVVGTLRKLQLHYNI